MAQISSLFFIRAWYSRLSHFIPLPGLCKASFNICLTATLSFVADVGDGALLAGIPRERAINHEAKEPGAASTQPLFSRKLLLLHDEVYFSLRLCGRIVYIRPKVISCRRVTFTFYRLSWPSVYNILDTF